MENGILWLALFTGIKNSYLEVYKDCCIYGQEQVQSLLKAMQVELTVFESIRMDLYILDVRLVL